MSNAPAEFDMDQFLDLSMYSDADLQAITASCQAMQPAPAAAEGPSMWYGQAPQLPQAVPMGAYETPRQVPQSHWTAPQAISQRPHSTSQPLPAEFEAASLAVHQASQSATTAQQARPHGHREVSRPLLAAQVPDSARPRQDSQQTLAAARRLASSLGVPEPQYPVAGGFWPFSQVGAAHAPPQAQTNRAPAAAANAPARRRPQKRRFGNGKDDQQLVREAKYRVDGVYKNPAQRKELKRSGAAAAAQLHDRDEEAAICQLAYNAAQAGAEPEPMASSAPVVAVTAAPPPPAAAPTFVPVQDPTLAPAALDPDAAPEGQDDEDAMRALQEFLASGDDLAPEVFAAALNFEPPPDEPAYGAMVDEGDEWAGWDPLVWGD